jgi:maltooligosyltrehalose trehalohydrolase
LRNGATLRLAANLSPRTTEHHGEKTGKMIWGGEAGDLVPPWSVFWQLEAR